jgi:hypothetical protein
VPWLQLRGRVGRRKSSGTIAYYPQPAGPWYTMPLALASSGIRKTKDLSKADAVMIFDDRTLSFVDFPQTSARLINAHATDISKAHVGRVFERVFGYPLSLDPTTHIGPMVEKADLNGVHDGRIVEGPLAEPKPGCIYQVLADSTVRAGVTEDLRCVCVGGDVIQVFRKEKADTVRFQAVYLETTLQEAESVFSVTERVQIAEFCRAMGLEFGSIDVLRDHAGSGRIYVVDVNKTCMPVLSMPVRELNIALRRIGRAAEDLILRPAPKA